ncbi:hypothetical protein C8Q78DRAFT_4258 [Trametes maxima]|nr:hypothetical protein C8Q78DRAFT_4258 [Trametes maxima]
MQKGAQGGGLSLSLSPLLSLSLCAVRVPRMYASSRCNVLTYSTLLLTLFRPLFFVCACITEGADVRKAQMSTTSLCLTEPDARCATGPVNMHAQRCCRSQCLPMTTRVRRAGVRDFACAYHGA